MAFPVDVPEKVPPMESICNIGNRFGWLKAEETRINTFVATQAKSYALEIEREDLTKYQITKLKGFGLISNLTKIYSV